MQTSKIRNVVRRAERKIRYYSGTLQKSILRKLQDIANSNLVRVHKYREDANSSVVDDLQLTLSRDPFPGAQRS